MDARKAVRWARALGVVVGGLLLAGGALRAGEEPKAPAAASAAWRDLTALEKHLAAACDAVEEVCGAKFRHRPGVRISTAEQMKTVLQRELGGLTAMKGQDVGAVAETMSRFIVGKYDEEAVAVHVLPANAERLAGLTKASEGPGDDDLRVLLAHEVTHALDWERFGWGAVYRGRSTLDGLQAFNAISEGHAQWVAEKVAERWGVADAFERLTHELVGTPSDLPEAQRLMVEAMAAQLTFAYVRGLEFVRALEKARGLKGLEATLRTPPPSTRDIEQPERWLAVLDGTAVQDVEPDLDLALADLRTLVGDPAWKVQSLRLLEAVLKSQMARVPPEDRPTFLRGYQDGRLFAGQVPGEEVMATGLVMLFREAADAANFGATERHTADAQKGEVMPGVEILSTALREGAGPGGALPGLAMTRELRAGGKTILLQQQVAVVGRVVLELLIVGVPDLDRAAQDAALGRAALRLTDPAAAAKAPPLASKPYRRAGSRALVVHVTGPEGAPVARFQAEVRGEHISMDLRGARGELRTDLPLEGAFTVSVWGFEDAEGKRLPLAPTARLDVPAGEAPLEVRLVPGLEVRGTVVDAGGQPAAGLRVEARPIERRDEVRHYSANVHAGTETAADGSFVLVGVNDGEYRLFLLREGAPASADVPTVRGGARDLRLVIRPVRNLTLTVEDADGRPVAGAAIRMDDLGNSERSAYAETDAAGRAVLEGIDPAGEFWLHVTPGPEHPSVGRTNVFGWKPSDAPLRLPRGRVLKGRVVDLAGKPAEARVSLRTSRGSSDSFETEEDGSFSIPSVPIGPAYVAAQPPLQRDAQGRPIWRDSKPAWVKVLPEAGDVTLVLGAPPGPDADVDDELPARAGGAVDRVRVAVDVPAEPFDPPQEPGKAAPARVTFSLRVADARAPRRAALARRLESGFSEPRWFALPADGRAELAGIVPGRYALWVEPVEQDARCAYLPEVAIDGDPLEVRLGETRSVRFRLKLPSKGWTMTDAEVVGPLGLRLPATESESGEWSVGGLPAGTWTVRVSTLVDEATFTAEVDVKTGTPVEIEPKPKAR